MQRYPSVILNDLHTYFPDLLYRPNRFANVGDVLNYIIGVANQNPYEAGRAEHQAQHQDPPHVPAAPAPPVIQPPIRLGARDPSFYEIIHGAGLPGHMDMFSSARPRTQSVFGRSDQGIIQLINQLMDVPPDNPPQNFMDPVVVRPSAQQIMNGSEVTIVTQTYEQNCAICQDSIDEGQYARILDHCMHPFHRDCIDTWFQSHVTCPTCRHDIREP
jgi:hypothetical protein